jgi:DNA-binding winged helix-turn-helix (wHTH) protein/Tfp pilus assembly protein PilF
MPSSAAEKPVTVARKLRFGVYEVDLRNRELRRRGMRLKLQHKPFQILEILLQSPGQLVRRSELARQLWPSLHVNFDRSLNTAVNTLRKVLGDTTQNPVYIETRAGLGYRFIAPVEDVPESGDGGIGPAPVSEANRDCVQARYFCNKLTEEDLHKGVAYFEAALGRDARCAPAHAGLADAYSMFAVLNMMPYREAYPRAKAHATAALRIHPGLGEAHSANAWIKRLFEWDWAGAVGEHLLALDLSPNSAGVHRQYGAYLAASGKTDGALAELERARELDPLCLAIHVETAWALYVARDFTRAAEESWRALVMEPKFAAAQLTLGLAYEQMQMTEEAIVEFRNARTCSGDQPAVLAALAHAYSSAGKPSEALENLQALRDLAERRYVSPYWYGIVYTGLGDPDAAFESLGKARGEHDVWLTWLKAEPRFDPLRSDSRFADLAKAVS